MANQTQPTMARDINPQPFRFLNLPLEIQIKIFELMVQPWSITASLAGHPPQIPQPRLAGPTNHKLLLVSRHFYLQYRTLLQKTFTGELNLPQARYCDLSGYTFDQTFLRWSEGIKTINSTMDFDSINRWEYLPLLQKNMLPWACLKEVKKINFTAVIIHDHMLLGTDLGQAMLFEVDLFDLLRGNRHALLRDAFEHSPLVEEVRRSYDLPPSTTLAFSFWIDMRVWWGRTFVHYQFPGDILRVTFEVPWSFFTVERDDLREPINIQMSFAYSQWFVDAVLEATSMYWFVQTADRDDVPAEAEARSLSVPEIAGVNADLADAALWWPEMVWMEEVRQWIAEEAANWT